MAFDQARVILLGLIAIGFRPIGECLIEHGGLAAIAEDERGIATACMGAGEQVAKGEGEDVEASPESVLSGRSPFMFFICRT